MTRSLSMAARATLLLVSWSAAEASLSRASAQGAPASAAVMQHGSSVHAVRPEETGAPASHASTVSAQRLIGVELVDANERRVGTVRDILFGADGRATAIIASGGYLLSLGRTHYRVPWSALRFSYDDRKVGAALALADIESYSWRQRGAARRDGEMRARKIMSSRVALENGSRYGRVRDVVFRESGRLNGLLIVPAHRVGDRRGDRNPRLYDRRFSVEAGRIRLPYGRDAL